VTTHRVTYELKGVRIIDVTTKGELPENWNSLKTEEQDEWLYENQEYSVLHAQDIDYGKAVSVIELRSNLRVVP
jgi:hypothetical protein